jgi:hypothetical protein
LHLSALIETLQISRNPYSAFDSSACITIALKAVGKTGKRKPAQNLTKLFWPGRIQSEQIGPQLLKGVINALDR